MEDSKKGDFWSDRETRTMLSIVRQKHITQMRVGATKRNRVIFEDIVSELRKKNILKSHVQVRNKFKSLKSDFFMTKRNNKSGAKRQTPEHFELLDELFGSSKGRTAAKAEGIDVIEMDCENNRLSQSPSVSDSEEPSQPTQSAEENILGNEPDESKRKNNVLIVLESLIKEWKESKKELLQNIKEHMQNLMGHQKKQEELLKKSIETLERNLEKDREEIAKMLQDFLTAMPQTQATVPHANQSTIVEPSSSNSTSLLVPKLSPGDDD